MKRALRSAIPGWCTCILLFFSDAPVTGALEFRFSPVVYSGQQGVDWGLGPGLPTGEAFRTVGLGVINNQGEVTFPAFLSGDGGTDESIWSTVGGSLLAVAREGSGNPGPALGNGYFFNPGLYNFGNPELGLSEEADVAFIASIRGPNIGPSGAYGIWNNRAGAVTPIAIDGNTSYGPGLGSGITFSNLLIANIAQNARGNVAFTSQISGPGVSSRSNTGLWTNAAGTLVKIMREGDRLSDYGFPSGLFIQAVETPAIDDAGRVTFGLRTYSSDPAVTYSHVLYTYDAGTFQTVAGTGSAGPTALPGTVFSQVQVPTVNSVGDIVFQGRISGPGVGTHNDFGLWRRVGSQLQVIAREGNEQYGPQLGDDTRFGSFYPAVVGDEGSVVFRAVMVGPNVPLFHEEGLWISRGGRIQPIALEGNDTYGPQLSPGAQFNVINNPVINSQGIVVFSGSVTGPGYNSSNNTGLWMWKDGTLTNILQQGQMFDVNPDPAIEDLRQIRSLEFATTALGELGHATGLNDRNTAVVRLSFGFNTDPVGLFLVHIVPEPSAAMLMALGLCSLSAGRRASMISQFARRLPQCPAPRRCTLWPGPALRPDRASRG